MASLTQIRSAVRVTLELVVGGLTVYRTVPDSITVNSVGVIVRPAPDDTAAFDVAMGRGVDTYRLDLVVLANYGDADLAQDALDEYVTGAGAKSIRQAVFNNQTLGLANTNAHVARMSGYGAQYEVGGAQYVGAVLHVVVHTKGTE